MFNLSPSTEMLRIFAESRVLRDAFAYVDQGKGQPTLIREAVRASMTTSPTGTENRLIELAKTKLVTGIISEPARACSAEQVGDFRQVRPSVIQAHVSARTDRQLFKAIGQAWAFWAASNSEDARALLEQLPQGPFTGSALHLMALKPWREAIQNLTEGCTEIARRNFKRASEVSSQVGTETASAIQWTYVASFFHGPTEEG